jgi:NACalpha-BTF3-like transcription factor
MRYSAQDGDKAIQNAIANLHEKILGRYDAKDSAEIKRSFKLFSDIVADAKEQSLYDSLQGLYPALRKAIGDRTTLQEADVEHAIIRKLMADLNRIDAGDVVVNGRTNRMKISDPEVFVTRVDNERTRVYSRETGLFTAVDPNLESDVRREAERQVRQAALDNGILRVAATNARTTMTSFLRGLGFEQPAFW